MTSGFIKYSAGSLPNILSSNVGTASTLKQNCTSEFCRNPRTGRASSHHPAPDVREHSASGAGLREAEQFTAMQFLDSAAPVVCVNIELDGEHSGAVSSWFGAAHRCLWRARCPTNCSNCPPRGISEHEPIPNQIELQLLHLGWPASGTVRVKHTVYRKDSPYEVSPKPQPCIFQ